MLLASNICSSSCARFSHQLGCGSRMSRVWQPWMLHALAMLKELNVIIKLSATDSFATRILYEPKVVKLATMGVSCIGCSEKWMSFRSRRASAEASCGAHKNNKHHALLYNTWHKCTHARKHASNMQACVQCTACMQTYTMHA